MNKILLLVLLPICCSGRIWSQTPADWTIVFVDIQNAELDTLPAIESDTIDYNGIICTFSCGTKYSSELYPKNHAHTLVFADSLDLLQNYTTISYDAELYRPGKSTVFIHSATNSLDISVGVLIKSPENSYLIFTKVVCIDKNGKPPVDPIPAFKIVKN